MTLLANILVAFVAIQHFGFLVLEIFLWDKPIGRKIFGLSREDAATTKVLAANQGLYNGFLSAGLVWGVWCDHFEVKIFFLACVVVAGVFGGATVSKRIWLIQALPAGIALALVLFA